MVGPEMLIIIHTLKRNNKTTKLQAALNEPLEDRVVMAHVFYAA